MSAPASLSIGDAVALLRSEFPDATISKIRFLETEGLIHPPRTKSGYREFGPADLERIRYILRQQRDHFLPLRVIKGRLSAWERGKQTVPAPPPGPPAEAYFATPFLAGLSPDTRYFYHLSLSPRPPNPSFAPYPEFTTFPLPGDKTSFAFAFGSCFRPESAQGGQIFHTIAEHSQKDNLQFILLMGDQIYADDHLFNGIGKVATSLTDYRAVYARSFSK